MLRVKNLVMAFSFLFLFQILTITNPNSYAKDSAEMQIARAKVVLLGKAIEEYQKEEVWPGGNEYAGCYMWTHRERFLQKGGVQSFVEKAKKNTTFAQGAKALRLFGKTARFSFYRKWETPVYPTWAMIGQISNRGTTDAGYMTQSEIAVALVKLVKEMFLHPERFRIMSSAK